VIGVAVQRDFQRQIDGRLHVLRQRDICTGNAGYREQATNKQSCSHH